MYRVYTHILFKQKRLFWMRLIVWQHSTAVSKAVQCHLMLNSSEWIQERIGMHSDDIRIDAEQLAYSIHNALIYCPSSYFLSSV